MISNSQIIETLDRQQMLDSLSNIRQEWEEAANGTSLIAVNGSVGLILVDVTRAIGLTPQEQNEVLGFSI